MPAPALLGGYDDGAWVALVFEDIDGRHPQIPWRADELDLVRATLAALPAAPDGFGDSATLTMAEEFGGWGRLAASPQPLSPVAFDAGRLPRLVELAEHATSAVGGNALVHQDVRADNLLITPDRRVFLVDWPFARRGAPWVDTRCC